MSDLDVEEAKQLVAAIVRLAQMADRAIPRPVNPLTERLAAHLGDVAGAVPNTSASFDVIERANLQLALDDLEERADTWEVAGLNPDIGNYSGVSLVGLIAGDWPGPGETVKAYESVKIAADTSIPCLRAGIVLARFDGEPVAAMLYGADRRLVEIHLEVAAATQAAADGFLRRVRELMDRHNVLRGKVLGFAFGFGEYGDGGMAFLSVPSVARDEVILPEGRLAAIEEHAIGISEARDQLLEAGQHIKRGLLLYGPPGTGKTHTVSYLIGRMTGRTTVILSGESVGAVGQAAAIARKLDPATIVIEDVDLIGMDRGLPGGEHNPMLLQLLNEMDGLGEDVDVLFVLTTNRPDILEPALAARPGRVDQAIETPLPDADSRRRLLRLYLHTDPGDAALDEAVERTSGVAAAFIKELARRTTLKAVRTGAELPDALSACLTEMREQSTPLLRASLAAD